MRIVISVTILIFCFGTSVIAQRKLITSDEMYKASSAGSQKRWQMNHRVDALNETFADGVVIKTTHTIQEHVLPDRMRLYYEQTSGSGSEARTTETDMIKIGNMEYRKENDGPWTKRDLSGMGSGSGSGNGSGSGRSQFCQQFSVEQVVLNGVPAQLFEDISIVGGGAVGLNYSERRYWISDSGLFLKGEMSSGQFYPRVETTRNASTYSYDTDIKIEAPIK